MYAAATSRCSATQKLDFLRNRQNLVLPPPYCLRVLIGLTFPLALPADWSRSPKTASQPAVIDHPPKRWEPAISFHLNSIQKVPNPPPLWHVICLTLTEIIYYERPDLRRSLVLWLLFLKLRRFLVIASVFVKPF